MPQQMTRIALSHDEKPKKSAADTNADDLDPMIENFKTLLEQRFEKLQTEAARIQEILAPLQGQGKTRRQLSPEQREALSKRMKDMWRVRLENGKFKKD